MAGRLSARTVESLTKSGQHRPGRHTDGDGLHLHVRAFGDAGWVLRYRLHGRQRDLTLGGYPEVSLRDARAAAAEARTLLRQGVDPIRERQRRQDEAREAASHDRSFRAVAEALLDSRAAGWSNPKHAWQWRQSLVTHAYPVLGTMPVAEITTPDVLRVLKPIWTKTPETASRLRGRIEAVLDYARAHGWRTGENAARWRGNLAELLPRPDRIAKVRHHPALPWAQVPALMAALAQRQGMAALALRFAILTAARTGEVRGLRWRELDLAGRLWTVPAERMKMREPHRVPLSEVALAVLAEVRPLGMKPDALVFPGGRAGRPLSDMALAMLLRGMATDGLAPGEPPRWRDAEGRIVVPHGFRSSFRDWCGETRPEGREVAERALAHVVRGVEGAYARSDLLERRRPLMEAWGAWCVSVQAGRQAA